MSELVSLSWLPLLAYLIGSVPSGLLFSSWLFRRDIRKEGSGNIGATNVFRVLGWKPGLVTLFLDILKGALPVALSLYFFPQAQSQLNQSMVIAATALATIVGHNFSIFLKFGGGKGVATTAGVLLVLFPKILLWLLLIFAFVLAAFKFVSLASLSVALVLPIFVLLYYPNNWPFIVFAIITSLMVIIKHRSNIKRLLKGAEPKITERTKQ
jgi:glycerol-3-phosphate acyltransferase PlsY